MTSPKTFKCGFVSIVGPTNAGKSTFLNALLNDKISIVSAKPQTTYHSIKGIHNSEDAQIIFIDNPGFQRRKENIHRMLNQVAQKNSDGCDVLCLMLDISSSKLYEEFEGLKKELNNKNLFLLLNKIDTLDKKNVLPIMKHFSETGLFKEIIPISAKKNDGVKEFLSCVLNYLPVSEPFYPLDRSTDRPESFLYSEYIREKIYQVTKQEIPYRVRVEINDEFKALDEKTPHIYATIHIDSDSRKAILIGKQANLLKEIGIRARKDIEKKLNKKICLKLHVSVEKEWLLDKRKVEKYLELS
jgi:GTP-binding protein Era